MGTWSRRTAAAVLVASILCLALAAPGGGAAATGPVPPDTTITFGPLGWTHLTRPVFGYRSDNPEAYFECKLDSDPYVFCGPATYEVLEGHPGAELAEGTHTIEVRAVAPGGEADPTPAQAVITVDTHYPTATIVSGPTGFTHQQRPKFTLQVEGQAGFRCRIVGNGVRIKAPSCDGPTSFRPPRPLPEGAYEMVLQAFDLAGNETEDRVEFSVRTKAGPPPPPPNLYRGSVLYTGRGDGVKEVVFRLRGRRLLQASMTVNLACSGGGRRHRFLYELDDAYPGSPIVVHKQGGFRWEVLELHTDSDWIETLEGRVTPKKIVGSIELSITEPARVGNETCRTGRFLGPGRNEALSFRAWRHRSRP